MEKFLVYPTASSNKRKLTQSDCEADDPDNQTIVNTEEPTENNNTSYCYLFDGKHFKIIKTNNNTDKKISAQCQLCQKIIQGQKGSTGNFLSHIKVFILLIFLI